MGRPFLFEIPSLAGGLNEAPAEMIADNELALSENFHVDGPSIASRLGRTEIAGAYSEEILSVFRYAPSFEAEEVVLLGCESSLAKVDEDSITALGVADGRIYPTSGNRWWGEQYNDEFFLCQKGNGGVKRLFGNSTIEAGIAAPTTPPTAIDGGSGKKTAGTYRLAYRNFNTVTGARSNWSPLSKELALEDLRAILMGSIATSTNPQVNARQIGATRPDGAVIYLVGQINDNASTTFLENALSPDDYGEADVDVNGQPTTDVRHGLPPDQAWALAGHKERLFVLNREGLYWSDAGRWQSFKASNFLPVQKGVGLISWEGHGLVILTEQNAKILLGDTPSDWRIDTLAREHGSPAGKSAAIGDGTLFWYTGVNIVASSGGAPTILPRIERVRTTLDSIPESQKSDVVGETIPSLGLYCLSVPTSSGRKLIVYDYVRGVFPGVFPGAPKTMARLLFGDQAEAVYVAYGDDFSLYEYLSGQTDDGAAITSKLRTKNFGYENQNVYKVTRKVNVLTPATNATCTLRVYHDGTLVWSRTGLPLRRAGWKRFAVNTSGQPGTFVQAELEYAGLPQFRVERMQIEGVLLHGRRTPTL